MPVNINLLPDEVIARGVTPPDTSKLFDSYFAGSDQAQKQALQNLFAGGIPKDINGNIDYGKMAEMLARTGGAPQLQNVIGLTNLQVQQGLPPIPLATMPPESQVQRPSPAPVSLSGPPAQEVIAPPIGEKARPGQTNVTSDTEVPETARISVDGGPEEPLKPAQVASNAPTVPRFTQTEATPAKPVSGPPADRFAQIPSIPPQQAGPNFNADTAARWDLIGNAALEAARRADLAGNKGMAETYRAKAAQSFANSKEIREGLIGGQRKQAEVQVEQEKGVLDEAKKNYSTAQSGQYRLGLIDKSIKDLGPNWMGAGADARAAAARAYNTTLGLLPLPEETKAALQINPTKIATWEDFNKQSLNLGFELARTLGAREAMQIVQQATASVPNANQSSWGARLVAGAMRQAFQRQEDYYQFVINERRNNRSLLDADVRFNAAHPVQQYIQAATRVVPPARAIQFLQQNPTPENKKYFDETYGDGATIGVFGSK